MSSLRQAVFWFSPVRGVGVVCDALDRKRMFKIITKIMSKAQIVLVTLAALICCTALLHAQDRAHPADPESAFIPQADPVLADQRKASGRAHASKATAARAGTRAASGVTEIYGGWTLNCGTESGKKFCTVMQAQVNKQTGQRVFAVELRAPKDGTTQGTILLPFGLKLDSGVILRLDDKDVAQGLHFSTCLAQGCLVPVSFPSASIDAIRHAKMLTVAGLSVDDDQAVTFSVVLDGFAAAIDRARSVCELKSPC
jgi:invasion protein IalB